MNTAACMQIPPFSPTPKPVSETWKPEIIRLPRLTLVRRIFRLFFRLLCRLLITIFTRASVQGMENYPRDKATLVVINHLGDPDAVLLLAHLPEFPEAIGKIELHDDRRLRWIGDALGIIWVHRGRPDRQAILAALKAFQLGRRVIIAPEGRESLTGGLEEGTHGAAFLAIKAGVPIVPVTITGTEARRVEHGMKKLVRPEVTLTIGQPFLLPALARGPDCLEKATRIIMEKLAEQLPAKYRGVYAYIDGCTTCPDSRVRHDR